MKKHNNVSEKKQFKINLIKYGAIALAIVIVFVAVIAVLKNWENNSKTPDSVVAPHVSHNIKTYNGKEYSLKKNVDIYLMMGLDEMSGNIVTDDDALNNNQEADFLMLFILDNNASTITALHINRDTMVNMDKFGVDGSVVERPYQQIALAHTYGKDRADGCKNTVNAAKELLGNIDIEGYVSVPMDAVGEINDILGGIEVDVLQDLTYADAELVKGETVRLQGSQALTYVRTRYGLDDSSNKARMERQRQYVENLFDVFYSSVKNDDTIIDKLINSNTVNNMEARYSGSLDNLARKLMEYEFCGIYSIDGKYETPVNDKDKINMEFYPFEESIDEVLVSILYDPVDNHKE
ncbi:MAG: LCP family protein [Ruminococcus sp.]|nr:LCP family protein [Ruminococcus sp.]